MTRPADARVAEAAGASYLGAVLVPDSPRHVDAHTAREVADSVAIPLVIVVADRGWEDVARLAKASGASAIQLHGDESPEVVRALREAGPWELWKAVRVRSEADILDAVERFGQVVDALLLDGWHAARLGGTGRVFPWETLEKVRGRIPERLVVGVAGGLTADNVGEAVDRLGPDLVDVSSGVESAPGVKDSDQVCAFIGAALAATSRETG